ncbi:MAG: IclR family transcriptional regulator [Caldilineaceae bacterium]|nr:IclR family transcriptional regulator [Caldilineaceae bacterium]
MSKDHTSSVQSVVRALSLLDILAESPADCSLSEITKQAGLPTSTVHRLLTSLIQAGYVSQNPDTTRYRLGHNLIRLSHKATQKHDLIQLARPWLEEMATQTGETVNLTARFDDSVIQLDHVDSPNMLRVSYPSGERFPLHASASGKLFLAFLSSDERQRILDRARHPFTQATIIDKRKLEAELERIRQQGYAIDDAEREVGVRCVAAPIRNARGEVAAAISISGPSVRITVQRLHELAVSIMKTACTVSEAWQTRTTSYTIRAR